MSKGKQTYPTKICSLERHTQGNHAQFLSTLTRRLPLQIEMVYVGKNFYQLVMTLLRAQSRIQKIDIIHRH